jgi:hypothetical protein
MQPQTFFWLHKIIKHEKWFKEINIYVCVKSFIFAKLHITKPHDLPKCTTSPWEWTVPQLKLPRQTIFCDSFSDTVLWDLDTILKYLLVNLTRYYINWPPEIVHLDCSQLICNPEQTQMCIVFMLKEPTGSHFEFLILTTNFSHMAHCHT